MNTVTQEGVEIQTRALKPDRLSQKARPLLKFSPLAQFLRVVIMKPLGVILAKISGFSDFCRVGYHSRG